MFNMAPISRTIHLKTKQNKTRSTFQHIHKHLSAFISGCC
uniref:Uncharacterized protein n=1 Tax=Arundo donax TaxID=35708 RepID=A0A0A9GRB0_ARUDO